MEKYLMINGRKVLFDNEKNILEVIKRGGVELPTFCYHSELSVHGSCRLCMVEVKGRGILAACSTPPESGMEIKTNTEQIINIRKIIVELLLASHDRECTTCAKSESCKLQTLARRLGIESIRFKNILHKEQKDVSTYALIREPNKCVLCGDCVRFCDEIQSIGALGFANRGSQSVVCPGFGKELESSECVYCGQCARVCPTGAIVPKSEINYIWKALSNTNKKVVIAIAPAVRASIGEVFGLGGENGTKVAGKVVTALKDMGFYKVFDISFTADMTIVEEANEFLRRIEKNDNIPMFTSCCPAWVKFVEQYYPDFIKHLSTCRSPQGMYGSIARRIMPEILTIPKEDLVVVSVMPCTAKKYEARRPQLAKDGVIDIDYVLTTQELAMMIGEAGYRFNELEPSAFDMPLGFKTGGGVIFGNSGGVTEAVLRNVVDTKFDGVNEAEQFSLVRGEAGVREVKINLGSRELKIAVVYGLKNARKILRDVEADKTRYDFVEVMACPGGCVGGAGQPVYTDLTVRKKRAKVLYENDKTMELHKPKDNPYVQKLYKDYLGEPGSKKAHEYLHTSYKYKKRFKETLEISDSVENNNIKVNVCFGNNCTTKGSKEILKHIVNFVEQENRKDKVDIIASICLEKCSKGPNIKVAGKTIEHCTTKAAEEAIRAELEKL
ncbi:iron hydrogenase [Endomicrobiia bacterium]|nr:iron hydrogenase [Endomicrobiia bacterium]GHT65575.1 iron hydrogenase [Endomicrobiia bacterium]GHT75140.1 iron hydrogenase [Endomicrobiia bacterium]